MSEPIAATGQALNLPADSACAWVAALGAARTGPGRALDDYVEAQVHGGLRLGRDVTAVVADASFRRTGFEPFLARLGPALRWSPTFRLPPAVAVAAAGRPPCPGIPEVPSTAGRSDSVGQLHRQMIG
jgi:hypothetical protein